MNVSDYEMRLRELERRLGDSFRKLESIKQQVGSQSQTTSQNRSNPTTAVPSQIIHAVSPAGGILVAASNTQMTSGTCDVMVANSTGALSSAGYTLPIFNKDTANAVGASKKIMACFDGACWVCFWEAC